MGKNMQPTEKSSKAAWAMAVGMAAGAWWPTGRAAAIGYIFFPIGLQGYLSTEKNEYHVNRPNKS